MQKKTSAQMINCLILNSVWIEIFDLFHISGIEPSSAILSHKAIAEDVMPKQVEPNSQDEIDMF